MNSDPNEGTKFKGDFSDCLRSPDFQISKSHELPNICAVQPTKLYRTSIPTIQFSEEEEYRQEQENRTRIIFASNLEFGSFFLSLERNFII